MTRSTSAIMGNVALALVPGLIALGWYFGPGIAINAIVAIAAALGTEWAMLSIRGQRLARITDGTAIVTGLLLGLALPPLVPVWIVAFGAVFAMVFGKHVYGGAGHNPFNPAMVGYAMMIVSFPVAMAMWPPAGMPTDWHAMAAQKLGTHAADAMTAATPLDAFKNRGAVTLEEFSRTHPGDDAWLVINIAFLAGGLFAIQRKLCDWVLPASMLGTLAVLSALFYDSGSSSSLGTPLLHLFGGATMMAAFFIITDPVTAPDFRRGKILFAIGVGAITFIIRAIGAYPDGFAFAVLLMNAAVPLIEQMRTRLASP